MRARLLLLTVLVALLASAPAAAAPLIALPDAQGPALAGGRWAVIPVTGGMLVVDARAKKLVPRIVETATPCGSQFGIVVAVGGGVAAVECAFTYGQTQPRILIYDLAARTFSDVAGTQVIPGTDGHEITGVGRRWLAYSRTLHHNGSDPGLLDWRTGAQAEPTTSRRRVADLDAASGSRPLCRSISRPAKRSYAFVYAPPFALYERGDPAKTSLWLRRCGGRPLRVAGAGPPAHEPGVGDRFATWLDGRTIHARSLRGDGEQTWPVPKSKLGVALGLVQAGRHLFVAIQGGPGGGASGFGFTVYGARMY